MLASLGEPHSSTSECVLAQKLFESAFYFYFYYCRSLSDELFALWWLFLASAPSAPRSETDWKCQPLLNTFLVIRIEHTLKLTREASTSPLATTHLSIWKCSGLLAVRQELETKTKYRFLTQIAINYRSHVPLLSQEQETVSQASFKLMAVFCLRVNAGIVVMSQHAQLNSKRRIVCRSVRVVGDLDLLSGKQKILATPTLNNMLNIILSSG